MPSRLAVSLALIVGARSAAGWNEPLAELTDADSGTCFAIAVHRHGDVPVRPLSAERADHAHRTGTTVRRIPSAANPRDTDFQVPRIAPKAELLSERIALAYGRKPATGLRLWPQDL